MSSRRGMGSAGATLRRPAVEARRTGGDPSLVSALAGSPTEAGQALRTVQVAEVAEHPDNPRDTLGDLTELAASIKTLGLRQPVLVVPVSAFRGAHAVACRRKPAGWCSPVTGAGPRASWPGSLRCRRGCVPT
jgi:ParB-like nuclease domain